MSLTTSVWELFRSYTTRELIAFKERPLLWTDLRTVECQNGTRKTCLRHTSDVSGSTSRERRNNRCFRSEFHRGKDRRLPSHTARGAFVSRRNIYISDKILLEGQPRFSHTLKPTVNNHRFVDRFGLACARTNHRYCAKSRDSGMNS